MSAVADPYAGTPAPMPAPPSSGVQGYYSRHPQIVIAVVVVAVLVIAVAVYKWHSSGKDGFRSVGASRVSNHQISGALPLGFKAEHTGPLASHETKSLPSDVDVLKQFGQDVDLRAAGSCAPVSPEAAADHAAQLVLSGKVHATGAAI